jgi:hypothetical protein
MCVQSEQGERQADVVVVVATGGEDRVGKSRLQNTGDHLLGRGLAVAAGDGDHRQRETAAPVGRECPQREPGVGDLDQRQRERAQRLGGIGGHHRSDGTARLGGRDVLMTIETFPTQSHEQIAGSNRAAVDRDAVKGQVVAGQFAGGRPGGAEQIHHRTHHATSWRASRARRACVASENGRRTPAIS